MRTLTALLAIAAAGIFVMWLWIAAENARLDRNRLETPFREYAAMHGRNLKYGEVAPDVDVAEAGRHKVALGAVCASSRLILLTGADPGDPRSTQQLAEFREAYLDLHTRGLGVVALVRGTAAQARALRSSLDLPFPTVPDAGGRSLARLGAAQEPYGLLIGPDRRVLFVASGRRWVLDTNECVDIATLRLTGARAFGRPGLDGAQARGLDPKRPYVVNDLSGRLVTLPLRRDSVMLVLSPHCSTCPVAFDLTARAWRAARKRVPPAVVIAGDVESAALWLTPERRRTIPGAWFFADPADLLRTKLGISIYGEAAVVTGRGTVRSRILGASREDQIARLKRAFAGEGGDSDVSSGGALRTEFGAQPRQSRLDHIAQAEPTLRRSISSGVMRLPANGVSQKVQDGKP